MSIGTLAIVLVGWVAVGVSASEKPLSAKLQIKELDELAEAAKIPDVFWAEDVRRRVEHEKANPPKNLDPNRPYLNVPEYDELIKEADAKHKVCRGMIDVSGLVSGVWFARIDVETVEDVEGGKLVKGSFSARADRKRDLRSAVERSPRSNNNNPQRRERELEEALRAQQARSSTVIPRNVEEINRVAALPYAQRKEFHDTVFVSIRFSGELAAMIKWSDVVRLRKMRIDFAPKDIVLRQPYLNPYVPSCVDRVIGDGVDIEKRFLGK